jgi:hypothetical protein
VNTAVKFNGREYTFAFLRADVPFPIIGLDFLRFFGMQVNPLSPAILITPTPHFQGGGTAGNVFFGPESCLKVAAGACPVHPRIMKMLREEFPELL